MQSTATLGSPPAGRRRSSRPVNAASVSAWSLGFLLVTYLAFHDGGYDTIARSEAGVVVWWVLLLGALAGVLPGAIGAWGKVAIGLLAGFAVWTGIAISWSQSAELSVLELGREVTYLGFLLLAILLQARTRARHTLAGVACAIGLVTVLAVLSRLHPQLFPVNAQFQFLGSTAGRRLSYPLNYWNALAAFTAVGVPLLLTLALGARATLARCLAAGAVPVSALCVYLTVSRGGVLELAVGIVVFLAIVPRRLEALATGVVTAAGSAILVWAADHSPSVQTGLRTPAAIHAGNQLLILAIVVCLGVGLLQAALTVSARRYRRPAKLRMSRRASARAGLMATLIVVVAAVAIGAPGRLDHLWQQFKAPTGVVVPTSNSTVITRLSAINGDGRYQYWVAAVHAFQTRPWGGIGPGTFQFWWASHATVAGPVLNAHSLYMETLAETGLVGFVLLVGLLGFVLGVGIWRSLRAEGSVRIWIAAATAGFATFMAAAAIDWVWQLAAIVAAVLVLAAVIVAGRGDEPDHEHEPGRNHEPGREDEPGWIDEPGQEDKPGGAARRWFAPVALALCSALALVAISIPLAASITVRNSQLAAQQGNLTKAYRDSLTAASLEPYAGSPYVQQALVLEAAGDFRAAAQAAQQATDNEPTDWQVWLTLARIDSEAGAERQALAALATAHRLNRLGSVFTNP